MKIEIAALSEKTQDRARARQSNFYKQTVAQNNARLETISTMARVIDELKFIESELLLKHSSD